MFRTVLITASLLAPTAWAQVVVGSGYTSPAATKDQARYCPPPTGRGQPYPPQWTWGRSFINQPRSALPSDNLKPRIEQHRMIAGTDTLVAVWQSFSSKPTCQEIFRIVPAPPYTPSQLQHMADTGCGPFGNTSHVDLFRLWRPGDTFLVYPAVYTGEHNNIVLQPGSDYYTAGIVPAYEPDDITVRGVAQNGIRPVLYRNDSGAGDYATTQAPVYILGGTGVTLEGVDVELGPHGNVETGLIYDNGGGVDTYSIAGIPLGKPKFGKLTLRGMRVEGAEKSHCDVLGANGIFSTPNAGGTLRIDGDELAYNGSSGTCGSSGPGHNAYLAASALDPNFTVVARYNWSHDAYFGHDFKSRAQRNIISGNYFQGGLPQGGAYQQAEAYNLDIPNGGTLVAKDNILVKNQSGVGSNGVGIAFGEEGAIDDRPQSYDIEHNTFGAFSAEYDNLNLGHYNVPMWLALGGRPATVAQNLFFGFCPTGNATTDKRGAKSVTNGFSDMRHDFAPINAPTTHDTSILGVPRYQHVTVTGDVRHGTDVGALN
jgi:hypothetical protein